MLILKRKKDQVIRIGNDITVMVTEIGGGWVKLGIEAPRCMDVHREEAYEKIRRTKSEAGDDVTE